MMTSRKSISLALLVLFPLVSRGTLEIAEVKRDKPVDFQEEILPILRANCLACHNRTRSKGDAIMETPDDIRKGNDGGSFVEPGNAEDSFLFQVASHLEDPIMPPAKNKVDAKNLTPEELGLLKLWIDQGAKGTLRARLPVTWQQYRHPNPPIYASAIDGIGRFAAAGRGNRIHLYDLATGEKAPLNLADPSLAKFGFYGKEDAAHLSGDRGEFTRFFPGRKNPRLGRRYRARPVQSFGKERPFPVSKVRKFRFLSIPSLP